MLQTFWDGWSWFPFYFLCWILQTLFSQSLAPHCSACLEENWWAQELTKRQEKGPDDNLWLAKWGWQHRVTRFPKKKLGWHQLGTDWGHDSRGQKLLCARDMWQACCIYAQVTCLGNMGSADQCCLKQPGLAEDCKKPKLSYWAYREVKIGPECRKVPRESRGSWPSGSFAWPDPARGCKTWDKSLVFKQAPARHQTMAGTVGRHSALCRGKGARLPLSPPFMALNEAGCLLPLRAQASLNQLVCEAGIINQAALRSFRDAPCEACQHNPERNPEVSKRTPEYGKCSALLWAFWTGRWPLYFSINPKKPQKQERRGETKPAFPQKHPAKRGRVPN